MQRNDDYLSQLPTELIFQILKYSDTKAIVSLSKVSCTLYSASNSVNMWRAKFNEAGCSPELFQAFQGSIIEYAKLYYCFLEIAKENPKTLSELVTSLVKNYLNWLQSFSMLSNGNETLYNKGITIIDDIFKNKPEEVPDVLMLDMIAKLISIDEKQSEEAYQRFQKSYKKVTITSQWDYGPH